MIRSNNQKTVGKLKPKNVRKRKQFAVVMILLLLLAGVVLVMLFKNKETVLATVNGYHISLEEFYLVMKSEKQETIQFFRQKYHLDENQDFWQTKVDGTTPMEVLKQETMKTLLQNKVEQILAQEYQIIEEIDYESIVQAMGEENLRRKGKLGKDQVVYGLESFQEQEYYEYIMSNLRLSVKKRMAEQAMVQKEDKLLDFYEEVKELEFNKGYEFTLQVQEVDSEGQPIREPEDIFLDDTSLGTEESVMKSMYNEAVKLSENETSDIITMFPGYIKLKCIQKEHKGYEDFNDVKYMVADMYTNTIYYDYIVKEAASADMVINDRVYERIVME